MPLPDFSPILGKIIKLVLNVGISHIQGLFPFSENTEKHLTDAELRRLLSLKSELKTCLQIWREL